MKLTIVIPARNEQDVIIGTLNSIKQNVKTPHIVLIIDDSNDNTSFLVRKYMKRYKGVNLIRGNPQKKSFARALKIGFDKAKEGMVVVVMADMCDDPKTIDKMYKKSVQGWDIVCGSRYMKRGKKIGGPKIQNLFSSLICKMINMFTGIPTQDVSNAFKMYRLSILDGIKINLSSGVEASMEITLQAFFKGAKITEIPTTWKGRTLGQSKFRIFHRTPKYARIVYWSLKNSLRRLFGLGLKNFYIN